MVAEQAYGNEWDDFLMRMDGCCTANFRPSIETIPGLAELCFRGIPGVGQSTLTERLSGQIAGRKGGMGSRRRIGQCRTDESLPSARLLSCGAFVEACEMRDRKTAEPSSLSVNLLAAILYTATAVLAVHRRRPLLPMIRPASTVATITSPTAEVQPPPRASKPNLNHRPQS